MIKMEEALNINMDDQFNPSWINALDDIMMEWFDHFCTGFM